MAGLGRGERPWEECITFNGEDYDILRTYTLIMNRS